MDDLLQTAFGGFQLLLAMRFQRLAALVKRDRVLEIDLALLQAGDDLLEPLQCDFETEVLDRFGLGFGGHILLPAGGVPENRSGFNSLMPSGLVSMRPIHRFACPALFANALDISCQLRSH